MLNSNGHFDKSIVHSLIIHFFSCPFYMCMACLNVFLSSIMVSVVPTMPFHMHMSQHRPKQIIATFQSTILTQQGFKNTRIVVCEKELQLFHSISVVRFYYSFLKRCDYVGHIDSNMNALKVLLISSLHLCVSCFSATSDCL